MYVKKIICKNVGPIKEVNISPSYTTESNPKPIVFVGENGTGKSTIISNIVDSFYEMARKAYNNACEPNGRSGYQYYKAILPNEIYTGMKGMF